MGQTFAAAVVAAPAAVVGAAAAVVAVLVALVSNGVTGALIILGVIFLVQQLEGNVLSPWLQSQSMNLQPAVVLLSVTLGSTLFGITGAFLAVPTVAVVAVVLRYLDALVTQRSFPADPEVLADPARSAAEAGAEAGADPNADSDAEPRGESADQQSGESSTRATP